MLTFEFSQNFNGKLFLDHFGDIRLKNEIYSIGNEGEITLKGTFLGYGIIEAIKSFPFSRISDSLAYINCGKPAPYQAEILNRFYGHGRQLSGDAQLVYVVFRYTQRNIENQNILLADWWKDKNAQYGKNNHAGQSAV